MFLTTRCPQCATTFEVAPDQLRIRGGWVRCGECAMVFDGHACRVDAGPLPAEPVASVNAITPPAVLRGKTLGILGLGNIGQRLAQLGAAMGMRIAYLRHNRIHDDYTPYADAVALAAACDVLALTCPGGPGTYHAVNATVLQALGPAGFLVNVARGTVVDTEALAYALAHGGIAGAALDVWEGEPEIPDALRGMDQVILTPHLAGRSPETRIAQHDMLARNLDGWFAQGRPVHRVDFPV